MLNGARAPRRWPMAHQKTKRFKPIPGRVAHNTLLKATFGLKLLHLPLFSMKSQERVTFPTHVELRS
jgi:hypothetical protein